MAMLHHSGITVIYFPIGIFLDSSLNNMIAVIYLFIWSVYNSIVVFMHTKINYNFFSKNEYSNILQKCQ